MLPLELKKLTNAEFFKKSIRVGTKKLSMLAMQETRFTGLLQLLYELF